MSRLYFRIYLSAVVKVAFCYALAYFTRYAAVALLPVVVRSLVRDGYSDNPGRRAVRLAVFVGSVMLFLLPHFILTTHVFGDPFYQENWRNRAMKMYGGYDWSYLKDNPFDGFLSVIASDPVRFISMAVRELGKFIFVDLIRLGGFGITGGLFAAAAMGGLYLAWLSRDRGRVLLMVYLVFFVGLVCTFFYTSPRFMLPILPVGYILSGYFILSSGAFSGYFSILNRQFRRSIPVVAGFLLFLLAATARDIPRFYFPASH